MRVLFQFSRAIRLGCTPTRVRDISWVAQSAVARPSGLKPLAGRYASCIGFSVIDQYAAALVCDKLLTSEFVFRVHVNRIMMACS